MSKAGEIVVELKLDDNGMAVAVTRAGTALREFQQDMNRTAVAVTRLEKAQGSLSTKFRHLVMTLGNLRFVAMDINDIFLRLPASIMKSAGELERMQFLMTGLSKETTKAGKELEGLKNFDFVVNMSKTAPFDISALADSFVKLKVAGVDPTNGSLETLVDSVARFGGTSEILKRASIAIQQMSGKGRLAKQCPLQ
jgi:phage tail tape-measure protein